MRKRISALFMARSLCVVAALALAGAPLPAATNNPLRIAILHWYAANQTAAFVTGGVPVRVAFDGFSM